MAERALLGALLLAGTLLSVLAQGFALPSGINAYHWPILFGWAGSTEGPHDAFVLSLEHFVTWVWPALALLVTEENWPWLLTLVHLLTRLATVALLFALLDQLVPGRRRRAALLAAALVAGVASWIGSPLGHGEVLLDNLSHSSLNPPLALAVGLAALRRRWSAAALLLGLMVNVNAFVAAWLALALALGLMFQRRRRGLWWALGGGTALAILLLAALGSQRLTTLLPAGSAGGRLKLWRESAALLADAPLTGIGLNNFVIVHGRRPEYQGQFVYQGFPHAHNLLLQTALDYGLPGLTAVAGLMAALAWAAWRAGQRLAGSPLSGLALGLAFGLLAHALHGAVDAVCIGSKAGVVPWAFAGTLAGLRAAAGRWARADEAGEGRSG